ENNGGYGAVARALGQSYGMTDERIYDELSSANPIDLCRYQVLNCYSGRIGLINSGGAAGHNDVHDAVRTAVINKRAGGCGLIMGRKAFQKPRQEGAALIQRVQDVYLDPAIPIA
ncbi:MAG: fructose-bisphosphate aldolase, partial [Cyanobacteriota bacterium]|nr:fructose-bisphosphate aldolase [Cyanobacteriota bacterium]